MRSGSRSSKQSFELESFKSRNRGGSFGFVQGFELMFFWAPEERFGLVWSHAHTTLLSERESADCLPASLAFCTTTGCNLL